MVKSSIASRIFIAMLAVLLTSCSNTWSPLPSSEGEETSQPVQTSYQPMKEKVMARTIDTAGVEKPVAVTMSGGGEIGLQSMDASDKLKMSRSLDAATGKTTTWVNGRTNITFSITPIKKVVIKDNPFCRQYQATAEKGSTRKEMNGTACVMSDGSWHTI